MSDGYMFVRVPGGDVVRRKIAHIERMTDISGRGIGLPMLTPELADDEILVNTLGDKIPRIIKTR